MQEKLISMTTPSRIRPLFGHIVRARPPFLRIVASAVRVASIVIVSGFFLNDISGAEQIILKPEVLAEVLARAKASVNAVKIEGNYEERLYNADGSGSERIESEATFALLSDLVDGRFRLDYQPLTTTWTNGKGPYFQREVSIGFNGKYATEVTTRQGRKGAMADVMDAVISEKVPERYGSPRLATGEEFITGLLVLANGQRLTEALSKSLKGSLSLADETSEGRRLLVITWQDTKENPCTREQLSLDPSRGFALVRREAWWNLCNRTGTSIHWSYVVDELTKITDGFYVPKQASLTRENNGKAMSKLVLSIKEAAKITSDDVLPPIIKAGYHVTDERYNISFTVGEKPEKVIEDLKIKK
jgi:hypothetical protein